MKTRKIKIFDQILGITGGGQTFNVTKKHFYEFLIKIVEIANLQTSYLTIDECLKITLRRVNALEFIVIPRIQYTIKYYITELDERSKEDKFKIKKILANKRKHKEAEEEFKELEKHSKVSENILEDQIDEDEHEKLFK
jgi:V-type H+-transporting ATPase subunit D